MSLTERIAEDMKAAMKAGDKTSLETLRTIRAAILEVEKQKVGTTLSEDDDLTILNAAAKKRREAIEQYRNAGRSDLAEQEERELAVIARYLPAQLDEAELLDIVRAAIADAEAVDMKDFGKVMGPLMKQLKGKADGTKVQALLKSLLGGGHA
ncbi:MAG: GatB/YqeY domain-containing protein [Bacteroidia bacterium]|nr:GatB/YqeY domain-containing protein [Bacteroidia bacterium]